MNKHKLPDLPAILLFFGMIVLALVVMFMPSDGAETYDDKVFGGANRLYLTLGDFSLDDIKEQPRGTEFTGSRGLFIRSDSSSLEMPNVILKGRGNSTWGQKKSPYAIKINGKVDLIKGETFRSWNLLANYYDDSNLRNEAGLFLAELIGMPFSIRGDFVDVYVNDDYLGLYYMTDKVEIRKGRIDLREPTGVLVERLSTAREGSDDVCYVTINEECLIIKDTVSKDNTDIAMRDFVEDFKAFEKAIEKKDFAAISKVADIESVAKYYLLSEFSVNPDAYYTSEYFYKDGEDDLIHMGPGWDFDYAFGNTRWGASDPDYYSPTALGNNLPEESFMALLLEMPEFQSIVREVYADTIGAYGDELVKHIISEAGKIELAAMVNNLKWGMKDYRTQSKELISWIKTRLEYLDGVFSEVVE